MTTTANEYDKTPRLNVQQWAKFRRELLSTGTYNPELWDHMDSYQKAWTQDTLNTLKSFNNEQD